jgi:hypothetical protein
MGVMKMKNKFTVLIIFVSFTIIMLLNILTHKASDQKVLINAFKSSKANLKNININYWGRVNSKFMDCSELRLIALKAIKNFDSKYKFDIKYLNTKSKNRVILNTKNNLIIIAESTNSNGKSETYLTVDEDLNKDIDNLINENNNIKNIFNRYNKYIPTICLSGFFDGRISKEKMNLCESNILKVIDGKEIEKTGGAGFTSITAFTPYIKSNIKNTKKSNINIAYSYDEASNRTLMWLATPIIMNEY